MWMEFLAEEVRMCIDIVNKFGYVLVQLLAGRNFPDRMKMYELIAKCDKREFIEFADKEPAIVEALARSRERVRGSTQSLLFAVFILSIGLTVTSAVMYFIQYKHFSPYAVVVGGCVGTVIPAYLKLRRSCTENNLIQETMIAKLTRLTDGTEIDLRNELAAKALHMQQMMDRLDGIPPKEDEVQ